MIVRTASKLIAILSILSGAAAAHAQAETTGQKLSKLHESAAKAEEIASQPARDVGIAQKKIPAVLVAASAAPYGLKGAGNCAEIANSIHRLNGALGPDFGQGSANNEGRAGKIAEAGGQAVVDSLIPFRGIVREASGAAAAQRHLNAAIDAGVARRGFLHGLYVSKGCRTTI